MIEALIEAVRTASDWDELCDRYLEAREPCLNTERPEVMSDLGDAYDEATKRIGPFKYEPNVTSFTALAVSGWVESQRPWRRRL